MNDTIQVSIRKHDVESTGKSRDWQSVKRERQISPESATDESLEDRRKIRKTIVLSDSEAFTALEKNDGGSHPGEDIFDIESDSVLLDDLLSDFSSPDAVTPTTTSQEICIFQTQSGAAKEQADCDSDLDSLFQEEFVEADFSGEIAGFGQFRKCKVLEVDRQSRHTRLLIKDIRNEAKANVECHGFWYDRQLFLKLLFQPVFFSLLFFSTLTTTSQKLAMFLPISFSLKSTRRILIVLGVDGVTRKAIDIREDELVSISAKRSGDSSWIVDNDSGFVIIAPHSLVSGTTVVGANFCARRGVLAENFRGLDSLPNLDTEDFGMTVGTLVHAVLQKVLSRRLFSTTAIRNVVEDILRSRRTTRMLYDADLSLAKCEEQLLSYVPKIANFVNHYIARQSRTVPHAGKSRKDKNFKGTIERVREIEENIWLPELGLKGKIDVTVDARVGRELKVMPLEIKTGKPSFSAEHRGQLILYSMMLNSLGENVDAGLLLYIRENLMEEVRSSHPDRRDLIMLRNTLVSYLLKAPECSNLEDLRKTWKIMELPEPINHRMACPKCPYATLCSVYAERDEKLRLSESHVLREFARENTRHLTPKHIDYVLRWITMLKLEDTPRRDLAALKDIWMLEPRAREERRSCISELQIHRDIVPEGDWYLHTFVRKVREQGIEGQCDLSLTGIAEQEYVLVSTDTRINVSAGYVKSKKKDAIQILLDRDVLRQSPGSTFHVDRYPSSGSLSTRNLANVAGLLNDNEITNKLRTIVIDQKAASFANEVPRKIFETGAHLLAELNSDQRKAIMAVFKAADYMLIKGLPGTGKTRTLVALVELLVKMDRTVLITSHTHSAIDNILLKLDEKGVDFLRLGSEARVHPALKHKLDDVAITNCTSPESLAEFYAQKKVVAVTCLGATHSLVAKRIFDVCLVDESTQVLQPTLLRPIYSATKFVLVGDPRQLPPLVQNNEARNMGMDESLFVRLDTDNNTVALKLQYRMNQRIMSVANELTYGGSLIAGNQEIAEATLCINNTMVLKSCERWIRKVLSPNIEDSVIMLNTGPTYELGKDYEAIVGIKVDEKPIRNIFEAAIILRLVAVLLKGGLEANSIGIICPYVAQVELLRSLLDEVEINTVDQYQGRDKDVILYSCTRSVPETFKEPKAFEILQDDRRLTVAVTRAKRKLVVVGDRLSLLKYAPFEKLFDIVAADTIHLEPGHDNFEWDGLEPLVKKNNKEDLTIVTDSKI